MAGFSNVVAQRLGTAVLAAVGVLGSPVPAAAAPLLGASLSAFTVLGATAVTSVSPSVIDGHVAAGASGGANAVTGFNAAPGVATSDVQVSNGLVHAGTTNLSGRLTLDGQGNADAAWVFQMDSSLVTSPNAWVDLIITGAGAGVFWNVASLATIGSDTRFRGNLLALASISMGTRADNVCGRALADTGAVTLQMNILQGTCTANLSGSIGLAGGLDAVTAARSCNSWRLASPARCPNPARWRWRAWPCWASASADAAACEQRRGRSLVRRHDRQLVRRSKTASRSIHLRV